MGSSPGQDKKFYISGGLPALHGCTSGGVHIFLGSFSGMFYVNVESSVSQQVNGLHVQQGSKSHYGECWRFMRRICAMLIIVHFFILLTDIFLFIVYFLKLFVKCIHGLFYFCYKDYMAFVLV